MKYSIFGFNQSLVLQYKEIDTEDLLLLDYIYNALASPSMLHIVDRGINYVWLQHKKILEDLPILHISEDRLKHRIKKLITSGLVQSKQVFTEHSKGSKAYYTITEKCEALRFTGVENNTCSKDQVLKITPKDAGPGVKNNTSYNTLYLDNKLDKDNKTTLAETKKSLLPENDSKAHTINSIYELYKDLCPNLPKVKALNERRKTVIFRAYKKYGIEGIKEAFIKANNSEFLCGNNDRGWRPDIEWILGERIINILEGKYDNHKKTSNIQTGKAWEENVRSVAITDEEREAEEREADRLEAMGIRARF